MDTGLLRELYLRFHRDVYLFLYSILRNTAAAEDLMQDVFLNAIVSLPDDHPNFRAWLFTVARNLAIDFRYNAEDERSRRFDNKHFTNIKAGLAACFYS